jgi:hypothetical protein
MNHQEVRERLGQYLEGDMALGQRALLDAHLDGCEACTEEVRLLRATVRLLRDLPAPEAPRHLAERVVARIQDGEGRARWRDGLAALWGAIDPARYLPPLAAAALTSAVLIVGVRDLGWQIPGTRPPQAGALAEQAPPPQTRGSPAALPIPSSAQEGERALPDRPVGGLRAPFGASAAPEAPEAAASRSPEEDLELALVDPRAFIAQFRTLGAPEAEEDWLQAVAERAARRRSVADVARRLRETAGPEGHALATRFEGAAQAVTYQAEGR